MKGKIAIAVLFAAFAWTTWRPAQCFVCYWQSPVVATDARPVGPVERLLLTIEKMNHGPLKRG